MQKQQPATSLDDILAHFSSHRHRRLDGKALRRLKRRFPDLETQLGAEFQAQQTPKAPADKTTERDAAAASAGSVTGRATALHGVAATGSAHHQLRLRNRVARWVGRLRRAVSRRARAGLGG
ncbi:hypothetical protein P885DRAFT_75130 [Corynascus similis CBS 632.67]